MGFRQKFSNVRSAVWTAGFLFICSLDVHGASVRASLNRHTIMVGETALLQIVVEGGRPQGIQQFPNVPGLTFQGGRQAQSIQSINGQTTVTYTIGYSVTPSREGEFIIPSIRVNVGGAAHSTDSLKLTVTKSDPNLLNKYAFLRLIVPRNEIYLGEVVPLEIQVYVTAAQGGQAPQLKSDGFIIHKEPGHTSSQTQIGNVLYEVLTFRKSISAAKTGELMLGPVEMNLTLLIRSTPDANDPFSEFFGRNMQRRPVTLEAPAQKITVLPLPPNAPPSFTGGIGRFNWSVEASPNNVNAGDPITLKILVSGEGNLEALSLPALDWPDFRVYQPNSTVNTQDPLGLRGSKLFELVVAPQNSGVSEIPALQWSFFNAATKAYQTLSHSPIPISVTAAAGGQATPTVLAGKAPVEEELEQRRDIVHIKPSLGQVTPAGSVLLARPWFLALQLVPILGVTGLALWRKRRDSIEHNPKLRRRLETERTVRRGIEELKQLAAAEKSEEFHALVFRLLQEQLGQRLDLPSGAITEAVLDERLPQQGASPALISDLHNLFQVCNQARYAPVSNNQLLLDLQSRVAAALHQLQSLPD